ncbi:MAG TPA: leukotoxin LktA family filamentous adhesin, partial [Roseiarcus sp.]
MVGFASSAFAQAVNLGHVAQNSIVPDGLTATKVTVKGDVTNIRTSTFRGGNAYNSFSTFSEAAGNTVNLFVPKRAANLVNIVRNGPVDIEGTLNAYQNGQIGGNVVFADSYGMIVGKSGTLNVGGLTVVTPSGATLNSLIDSSGHVNIALAEQVIAGNVPLSTDGSVVIKGKVNAQNFVTITAQDVRVAGSYAEARKAATQRAQFKATVNSRGMQEGGAIVVHDGALSIVAANDATIGGTLRANGSAGHGGSVSISAGHNATIKSTARVTAAATRVASGAAPNANSASPTIRVEAGGTATIAGALSAITTVGGSPGDIRVAANDISVAATAKLAAVGIGAVDGGHISVKATDTTTVAAGASFAANATGSGDGGLIEISGETDNVAANIAVTLGAVSGRAGTLLFDPFDLYVGDGADQGGAGTTDSPTVGGSSSTVASLFTDGANVVLDATNSITVNGVIDTRDYSGAHVAGLLAAAGVASNGNSGSITLDAPTITIANGGALYADVYNATTGGTTTTWTPGAIILGAGSGQTIAINGTVAGGAVSATATGAITLGGSILGGPTTPSGGSSIDFAAPTITLTGGSSLGGGTVSLTAQTINVDAASSGGSEVTAATLNLSADTVNLTSAADVFVGDATHDVVNNAAAGFISNQTIASYIGAMGDEGLLQLSGASSITLDPSGVIDGRQLSGGISVGNSLSLALQAPTITLATGSAIHAESINANGSTYFPGVVELAASTAVVADGSVSGGQINVVSPSITTASGVFSAAMVDYNLAATDVTIGGSGSGAGAISNATVASYVAALSGTTAFELSASSSITVAASGVVQAGAKAVTLMAPSLILAAGSAVAGGTVGLDAGPNGTITIDADNTGGAQIAAATLQLTASTLDLTTSAQTLTVGDQGEAASGSVGFVTNQAIQTYVAAMSGYGTLELQAPSLVTIDATGSVDTRQLSSGGVSTNNSLNVALVAPAITIAQGGKVLAQAVNAGGSTFTPGSVLVDATGASATAGIDLAGSIKGGAIALTAATAPITLEATASIDARQLDGQGNVVGLPFNIALSAPSIAVASGASLYGDVDAFAFTESALTLGGAATGQTGANGVISNDTIAAYIASMNGAGTFLLSAAGPNSSITLSSNAKLDGTANNGAVGISLSADAYSVSPGAQVITSVLAIDQNQSDVVIGDKSDPNATLTNQTIAALIQATGSITATFSIDAADSITLDPTAMIDTRELGTGGVSTTNALNVALAAPVITIDKGAEILAEAVNPANAASPASSGAVTLTANATSYEAIGLASATTNISIDGTITGASIVANATSTAESSFALNANNTSPGNLATVLVGSLLLDLSPLALQPGYVQANASATISVGSGAVLTAGNVTLDAHTVGVASDPAIGLAGSGAFLAAGVVVGQLNQTATTTIASGATVNASSLDVAATNSATLDIQSEQISGLEISPEAALGAQGQAPSIQIDFTYAEASIASSADIASGANINVSGTGGSVDVLARNDNSFNSSATSDAFNGGKIGAAIAIGDFNSSAVAHVGASIGSQTAPVGSVSVVAQSETTKDKVAASTTVGASSLGKALALLGVVGSAISEGKDASVTPPTASIVGGLIASNSSSVQSATTTLNKYLPQVAGAFAVSLGTETSSADISADLDPVTGKQILPTAPTIWAAGGVAILSDTTNAALVTGAQSGVNASAPTPGNPGAYLTVSVGVAVTLANNNSSAFVGPGVTISASQIGIDATSNVPVPIENIDWTNAESVLTGIVDALTDNAGLYNTNAKAEASSSNVGIAGSLDFLSLATTTTAWVGTGAVLDTTGADASWTTTDLAALDPAASKPITTTFNDSQSVLASSTVETMNVPGDFLALARNSSSGGVSVGASLGLLFNTTTTIAGVAAGASLTSAGSVDVDAETFDHAFNVSPTSGSGTGINISGMAVVATYDDTTSSSISNDATVSANAVDITAHEALGIYTFTGDVTTSGASSVGVSISYASVSADTEAFVGDNSTVVGPTVDPDAGTYTTLGSVTAGSIDVTAETAGNDVVGAIAAQKSGSSTAPSPAPSSSGANQALAAVQSQTSSSVSLAISGTAAFTDTALTTAAYLDSAVVYGQGAAPLLEVQATNNTLIVSGSGAAAYAAGNSTQAVTAAVSAAAAADSNSDSTLAYIEGSQVDNVASAAVDAQSTGLIAVVGLGIAVASESSEQPAGGFAGSVSVALIDDRVAAYVDKSTLTGIGGAGAQDAVVLADQQTTIGIGGGSFFAGGQGGGGLVITYTDIADPSSGPATDAHISNSSVTNFADIGVVAESPQAVYSAGAEVVSSQVGLGGALVFTTATATTSATISNTGSTPLPISALDDVYVLAATDPKSLPSWVTAPTIVSTDSGASAVAANYGDPSGDSSANASDAALLTSGSAAILSIAGNIVVGGNDGVGFSSVDDTIGEAHLAQISGVTVTAPGAVTVAALDSTAILAIAAGLGSSNQASLQAANVTNAITSSATALIGPATGATVAAGSTVDAGAVTVDALDSSAISAYAVVASWADQGADGYSVATSTIDTPATAAINSATVTVTGATSPSDASGDAIVEAVSTGNIDTFALGVAASSKYSTAGSAATSLEESSVSASIDGSTVSASDNIGVLASNSNAVNAVAGAADLAFPVSAAGAGMSVTVDEISGSTKATIDNSAVDAAALGANSLLIVDGALAPGSTAVDAPATDPSVAQTPDSLPNLGADVRSDHGLAVVAGSVQTAEVVAVTAGDQGNVSVNANSVTNVMGGTTSATVENSSLDTKVKSAPAIDVGAYSVSYANDLVISVALSGPDAELSGVATIGVDTFDRTTAASVTGTTIGAAPSSSIGASAGAVTIDAEGYEGSSAEVIGLSSTGGAALTGNVLVNLFKADTEASLVGGTTYAASLSVTANATDGYFGAVGTAALGGDSGDGESVMVATFSDTTTATVGDTALATPTTLNLAGPLTVGATSAIDVTSYTVGVSAGGDAGAAAQLTLNELSDTTQAVLADTTATIASTARNGNVSVTSADNVAITPTTGGLAGGGDAGLGASANVVVLNSANSALMVDDTVSTPGEVSVLANETRDINLLTATASLGGEVGIAATVGVILVGPGSSSADLGDLNANGSGTLAAGTAATGVDLVAAVGAAIDGNSASIIGGSVTAASVTINATGALATDNIVGSLGVGLGAAGVGASVGYSEVDQTINATATGGTIITNSLSIAANAGDDGSGEAVDSVVFAGAGGLFVGVAGALAFSNDSDDVTAELSSTVDAGTGTVTSTTDPTVTAPVTLAANSVSVTATDSSTVWANAYGAAIGAVAAGVSVATADRDSTVTAEIATLSTSTITTTTTTGGVTTTTTGAPATTADDSADPVAGVTTTSTSPTGKITTTVTTVGDVVAGSVLVQASDAGNTYAYALAGAGGGEAGAGADASATDNATVLASVIGASTIIAPGSGLTVQATDTPDAKAFTFGVSVGLGDAVGASVSEADVTANVTANVDGAAVLGVTNGLSILAATDINGKPASSFPSSSTAPGSTSQFEQGGTTAAAWSIAGSGSLFVAANGTVATAESDATVTATGGGSTAYLALPGGNISVEAANNSDQFAQGDGVAISGGLAVGAVIVTAESSPNTTASLYATTPLYETSPGTSVSLVAGVIVSASGDDTNNALAIAGSGGLFAGDGASAATSDTSNVAATIGANSFIQATSIQIAASHTDNFGEMAESLNAGLVGASAALSSHDVFSNVGVTVGNGATLYATAAGLSPCLNGGCAPAIDITATNNYEDASSGTQAGAGGGINGAGATSAITFDNSSPGATITIGADAILSSGFDPVNDPGSIAIIASTTVFISDTDSLTTGGLIEGAGVNSEVGGQSGAPGQIDNSVTIGAGAAIATYGILDIGTYTTGSVTANAYVTTYGVAGVGEAIANINLTSNQTITVLASTTANQPTIINGFGDVNITAGDYIDGGYATSLFGDTNAEAYVRGLIAVPLASASTTIGSNATVDIADTTATGPQTLIASGANVTINADEGSPVLASDGTGHGYELGFIPVTDGSNNTSAPTTSVVTIGAAVVAGEYHTQDVTINSDLTITVAPGGAPVSYAATPNFDILTFLNDDFTGPGAFGNLVSTSAVPTVSLGALYASGGVIRIKADTLMGSGTLTAYGSPTITVTDNYPIYLILAGGAYIPDTPGGSVVFNGAAGLAAAQSAGMTVSRNVVDSSGTITVTLTYGGSVGDSSAGPGLFNTAPLTNVGGLIALYNDYGSIGSAGTVENANGKKVQADANITADQAITYEPNGAYVFQADDASGDYIAGGSAYSEWASAIVYPGGAPSTSIFSAPNADTAMEYVATSIYLRGSYNGQSAQDAGGGSYYYVSGTIATDGSAATEAYYYIDDALYGHAGNTYPHSNALVLFGGCIQGVGSSSCLSGGGYDIADVDGHYGPSQQPNYVYEGSLSYSYSATGNANAADNENLSGSAASQQVYGSYVAITAATIDVNGSITVGKSTSYSADVSAQLGMVLGDFSQMYKELYSGNVIAYIADWLALPNEVIAAGYTSAQAQYLLAQPFGSVDITPFLSLNAASASLSVPVTYNGATNQISFGNISTFSSGANVKLDGDIVSTNTLGNIHVNAGYGSVSITNESQIGLDLADINTGSAAGAAAGTSTVMITNRLIDQVDNSDYQDTATYIYNPATGLKEYLSDNGASPVDSNGSLVGDAVQVNLPSGSTSSSTTYQTVVGAEFQFVQEATLSRTVTEYAFDSGNPVSASDWTFSSGTAQDPWYYVNPSYISSLNASGPASSSAQSTTPVGRVIISSNVQNGVNQDPAFQETITGNTVGTSGVLEDVNYSDGSLGFATQPGGDVQYSYYYPTQAFLRLTTTVKADNPFGISFGGNATGSVNITSFGSLILGGAITNATGGAQIFSLTGSVTQTATATTTSNSLNVIGNLGIGSSGTPLDVTLSKGLGTAVGSLYVNGENGNVYVTLNSGANGFAANAASGYGTVVVNAAGTLASGPYGFSVSAANVTLTSTTGSIGSASSPLALISGYNSVTGSYDNVTANISAYGDVGLTVPHGNLLVGQIASTSGAGDITIDVPNGGVYSAVSQTPASSLTSAQVANIVSSLNIEAGSDAAAGAVSITSFQNTVDADLTSFAAFLANGSIGTGAITLDATTYVLYSPLANAAATQAARTAQNGSAQFTSLTNAQIQSEANTLASANGLFVLNATALANFAPQAAAALGIPVASITNAQIQAWANAQYQNYAATFTQAYGANWQATVIPTSTQASTALSSYQSLLAAGTVTGGVFSLTNASPTTSSYAAAAATANNVSVSQVTSAQIQSYANALYQSEATVFDEDVNAALAAYPTLIAAGTATKGVFTLTSADPKTSPYAAAAAAANGETVAQVTSAQIQTYANSLYQGYATVLSQAYGANWQTASGHATAYAYDFTVAAGSTLATSLTQGANWTAQQLVDAIDVSAFQPASGNVGSSATPNIVGHDVNITVGSGSVGTLTAPIAFSLALLASDSLTPQEQAAIAVATTPGSVQLTGTLANGQPLPAGTDLDNLPPGATVTGLSLPQTAPIFVSATGAFTISSAGAVYLQGTSGTGSTGSSSVTLNSVSAKGDVYVAAPGSILASVEPGAASTNIVATGDINLNAGTGSIGSSTMALTIQTSGVLTNASGGGDVYLSFASGNAEIERVSAGGAAGTASITTASGYSILSDLTGVNVEAPNIILDSGGTIGTSTTPFEVLASAAFTATATGAAYISAPTIGGNAPNNLTVASLVTGGDLSLVVGGALTVAAGTTAQPWTIDTAGNVSLTSASLGMQTGGAIQATGTIGIDTSGDATLGLVASTLTSAAASNTVTILAGGSILSNGDALNVQAATNGSLDLTATAGIGTALAPLTISAPYLTANVTGTDASISLAATSALEATQVQATGAVSLSGTSLVLDSVLSGGTQTLSATGNLLFTQLETTGVAGDTGSIDVTSTKGEVEGQGVVVGGVTLASSSIHSNGNVAISGASVHVDTVSALGAATIDSATSLVGTSSLTTGGDASLAAGVVTPASAGSLSWQTVNAGATFEATVYGGSINLLNSVTSGGTQTYSATGAVQVENLTANAGDIDVTEANSFSGKTIFAEDSISILSSGDNHGDSLTAHTGAIALSAQNHLNWTSLSAATTLDATAADAKSVNGDISIQTATSGGTQTLTAANGVRFTTLTTKSGSGADIDITATGGSITGGSLTADGSASLEAATGGNTGQTVAATTGSVTLTSGEAGNSAINWTTVNAATTFDATNTVGGIKLGSATSGGTQTIEAQTALVFTTLTTNVGSDADIDATSVAGSIAGGSLTADGSASLTSATSNQGSSASATNGGVTLVAGSLASPSSSALIQWTTNIDAATTLTATSGGALTLGTALTDGAQTIHGSGAVDVTTATATTGAIGITSDASTVTIGSVTTGGAEKITGNGAVSFTVLTTTAGAGGDIDVTSHTASITGGTVSADGSAKLVSGKSNTGDSVTPTSGDAEVDAGTSLSWSSVTAPKGAAILSAASGDLTVESVTAGKTASLTATTGSLVPMDASAMLSADSLTLIAGEDIGSAPAASGGTATPFAFTLGSGGVLSGSAGGSAWLTSANAVNVTTFSAASGLSLTSSGALRIETVTTPSTVDGLISSSRGAVTLQAASVSMDQGAGVTAGGAILISSTGGVTIGQVTSTSADTTAGESVIDIEAAGSILGNGGTALIEDTEAGVAATLNAGETIGPISVEIANLSATAAKGDLTLTALSALHATSLSAANGSVDIEGAPNLSLDSVTARTTLTVSSTGGFVTIGSASGESETIEANGAVRFTTLTTTIGDGGDIDVTSDTSSIAGVSLTADGSASLTSATSNAGVGATVLAPIGSLTATNGSVTLTAGSLSTATPPVAAAAASIDWATINAGTFVMATSGGALTLGSSTSGTTGAGAVQTIHATGAIGVTTLSATTGTIGVTSDTSTVKIGAATSDGTQTIEAYGALGYTALKTTSGDILLSSTDGSIAGVAGDTLDAKGSFDLQAATTIAATSLTAETGSGSATAGGALGLGTT